MLKRVPLVFSLAFLILASGCTTVQPAKKAPAAQKVQPAAEAKTAKKTVYKAPALTNPQSWTLVVVPDIQTYIKQMENQGILDMMLTWIVRRREEMNIRQVLFTGDLVYYNDVGYIVKKDGAIKNHRMTDYAGKGQWKAMSRLMERLDGEVPYVLCTGNHDYGVMSAENRNTWFNEFFYPERNPLTRQQLIGCAPNTFGVRTLETSAYEFQAPYPDGRKFLVITLPFAPTDNDLKWAKTIADNKRFENHFGIVLTHSYLYGDGQRVQKERYILNKQGGNAGEAIFQKLVYPAKNIRLVVCGHVCRPDSWVDSVGFSMTKNSSGKSVAQMAFNTQAIGGGFSGNGGDGWLRLLEFMPDKKTIKAKTFSPFFANSPSTRHLAWRTEPRNEFTFELE